MRLFWVFFFSCLFLAGCKSATMGPVTGEGVEVPMEQKQSCSKLCRKLDMKLGAMVIISNRAGCVCEVRSGSKRQSASGAVSAGAAVALIEEAAESKKDDERRRAEENRQKEEQQRRSRQGLAI